MSEKTEKLITLTRVDDGTPESIEVLDESMKNGVFIIPYFSDYIYKDYPEVDEEVKKAKFTCLMPISRWDGNFGWIGGFIDANENPREALRREMKEEINLCLPKIATKYIKPLCRHIDVTGKGKQINIIAYTFDINSYLEEQEIDITPQKFGVNIILNSTNAEHIISEIGGLNILQIHDKSIDILEKDCWASTSSLEAKILIKELGIDKDKA